MGGELLALIGTIIGSVFTNAFNQSLNRDQYKQQKELMGLQSHYNDIAAGKADERTRALYTDLMSPEAMRNQYEKAGLSVGMMYGQGGTGGTLPQGAQANATNIPSKSVIGMQNVFDTNQAKVAAEIAKTKAETEEIKTQATLNERNTDKAGQEINNLKKDIEEADQRIRESNERIENYVEQRLNTKADTELKGNQQGLVKAQTAYYYSLEKFQTAQEKLTNKEVDWYDRKSEAQIAEWKAAAHQYNANAKKLELETDIMNQQKQDIIDKFKAEAEIAAKENKNWDDEKQKRWDKIMAETEQLKNLSLKEQQEWRKNKQKADYYNWIERNVGSGAAGFWQIVVEDLIPL